MIGFLLFCKQRARRYACDSLTGQYFEYYPINKMRVIHSWSGCGAFWEVFTCFRFVKGNMSGEGISGQAGNDVEDSGNDETGDVGNDGRQGRWMRLRDAGR